MNPGDLPWHPYQFQGPYHPNDPRSASYYLPGPPPPPPGPPPPAPYAYASYAHPPPPPGYYVTYGPSHPTPHSVVWHPPPVYHHPPPQHPLYAPEPYGHRPLSGAGSPPFHPHYSPPLHPTLPPRPAFEPSSSHPASGSFASHSRPSPIPSPGLPPPPPPISTVPVQQRAHLASPSWNASPRFDSPGEPLPPTRRPSSSNLSPPLPPPVAVRDPVRPSLLPTPPPHTTDSRPLSALLAERDMSADLQVMIADLSYMKVEQLKLTIRRLNDMAGQNLRLSGVKHELYNRIRDTIYALSSSADKTRFNVAKSIIAQTKNATTFTTTASSTGSQHGGYSSAAYQAPPPQPPPPRPTYPYASSNAIAGGSGGFGSYSGANAGLAGSSAGLPAPRFNPTSTGTNGGAAGSNWTAQSLYELPISFRPNPFYRIEKGLCGISQLHKAGPGDRKSVATQFVLTEAQRALLAKSKASPANPQYQVRLYCTTEDYFNPARPASAQVPAPVEFPGTCEIKVNYVSVPANTKGIKKQPGTAPPADLGKAGSLDISAGAVNRVEIIYVNTDKRHFAVVYLVEVSSVKSLVDKIKVGRQRTKEQVIADIIKLNSDPDVEATSLGLSLKDPLSFARIKTPIRSDSCNHISCFDAEVFFMMNEQTPSFSCPICSKVIRTTDLALDGYVSDILKTCPSSIDAVTVEPDGTWRSSDDRHGTGKPRSTVPSTAASRQNSVKPDISGLDASNGFGTDKGKGKAVDPRDSLVLDDSDDDDDDDQPLAKRTKLMNGNNTTTLSLGSSPMPSDAGSSGPAAAAAQKKRMETIDLTLSDSDDDDEPVHVPPPRNSYAYVAPSMPRLPSGSSSNGGGGSTTPAAAPPPPPPVPAPAAATDATNGSSYSIYHREAEERRKAELARKRAREAEGTGSYYDDGYP